MFFIVNGLKMVITDRNQSPIQLYPNKSCMLFLTVELYIDMMKLTVAFPNCANTAKTVSYSGL